MSLLASLLTSSRVALDIEVSDKKGVFETAAALLEDSAGLSRKQIVDSLTSRERLGSTALGQGIAIPHGRVKGLREATAAFVRLRRGIPFDAPDHAPVTLVFVLLVPERATDVHLQILSELAQMFSDPVFRAQLSHAPDTQSVLQLIGGWQAHAPNIG